ncbi:Peptide/nickel transport system substrate-binding protein [Bosea sp. 62]|uniref:ABC transporter substrate-binding protein n=1 Tax=unclassified Bosea (in: a-proteobacteria) TaxID=2653178 RepID=UPI00125891B6|nr:MULTISPECIES: ABC transporter substrate-binding protein [unclassified Bosea (in: a-proteobacteria)]CAD5257019.1 Peptide/nickel transport system substrate-binding protein [Bosea sp. 46]CAD5261466.1 Peptide/nickel transport system substrate-binding protein [Bosea sp. 21B]CAD5279130.1 Peptide/nickel transport system substrate-binding protein [Bosea sp. 7B]VVT58481.1 Peptide/nickel transport system substrate-binding protein [Bosea sp. EC-HK365B]VXB54785.1 Peptide/nickel transport system substra
MPSIHRRDFLAASAALSGLALSGVPAFAQAPRRGGTLRVSVDQAVAKLNPLVTRVNPEYLVAELLYSGLTRLKPDMSAESDLAESWTNSADLTEWTFALRKGLTFHDGSPCTAADVVATFEAILDAKTASPARQNVGPIAKVTAKDDATVVFNLSAPFADLPVTLAYTNAKIVPAAVIKGGLEKLDRQAVGTGPFKLVSFEPERLIVVARNEAFYDKDRPYLDRIEVVIYPDVSAEASALISGDTDLITTTPPTEFGRLQKASGVKALRVPSGQFCNVNFGCDQKPFNDVRVRQALALTVDRAAMVDFVTEGFGSAGNDTPLNPAYRFYADLPAKKADIAKAKGLLAEAGYQKGLEATLIASDRPGQRTQLAVALREMAKPAGFDIKVETMPHATYLDQVWKKGSFYVGFYNMQATADAIFSLLYTSNAAWNETRWNNAVFDKLVFEARATVDEAKRRALYGEAQKLMNAEVPSIIPAFFDLLGAQRDWVEGYQLHPRGAVFRLDHVSLGAKAPKRG